MTLLTRDNHHLSEPTHSSSHMAGGEINCRDHLQPGGHDVAIDLGERLADPVAQFVRDSLAANTRRAYRFDLQHFEEWGGCIPCDPHVLASYLAENAGRLAVATLVRRLAAITRAHKALNYGSPARFDLVRATLRGIRRQFGVRQQEAKPLLRDDLFRVLDGMGNGTKDARDRALLLVGFAGGTPTLGNRRVKCRRPRDRPPGADRSLAPVEDRSGRRRSQNRYPPRSHALLPCNGRPTLARALRGHRGADLSSC